MTTSTHKAEVVQITLNKHPSADKLSLVEVFGYPVCVQTAGWADGALAAYIPPDSLVDTTRPEFAFLADKARADGMARIKAIKLRGVQSFGLLVPAPEGSKVGDDVAEVLGVQHYEPSNEQERGGVYSGGEAESPPSVPAFKYDVDAFRRYAKGVFTDGEPCVVTEKIHGCNSRFTFCDGRMHCGSRSEWKRKYKDLSFFTVENFMARGLDEEKAKEIVDRAHSKHEEKNLWWRVLEQTSGLEELCRANPGLVVYGETYGYIQSLRYGHTPGTFSFAAFDILKNGRWMDPFDAMDLAEEYGVKWVPLIGDPIHSYDFDYLCSLAEGPSLIPGANHYREGCVVSPLKERWDHSCGRLKLKIVSATYLEKS